MAGIWQGLAMSILARRDCLAGRWSPGAASAAARREGAVWAGRIGSYLSVRLSIRKRLVSGRGFGGRLLNFAGRDHVRFRLEFFVAAEVELHAHAHTLDQEQARGGAGGDLLGEPDFVIHFGEFNGDAAAFG